MSRPRFFRDTWKLVDENTGIEFQEGEEIISYREEMHVFRHITREPEPGKSGKIATMYMGNLREYYPQVFGLKLVRRDDAQEAAG